jgi:negative regulator of sigma E activity
VQVFLPGAKPKALNASIEALPGRRTRREVKPKKKGAAPFVLVRLEDEAPEKGLARLRSLYDLSVSTGGVVAKRKTWRVDLRLKSGLLRRTLWVDRDSGLLMKRETYRDDGSLARRERLTKLTLGAPVDAGLFAAAAATRPWAPDGFVPAGTKDGARLWSDGVETYSVTAAGEVKGLLAEDDAAKVRASLPGAK